MTREHQHLHWLFRFLVHVRDFWNNVVLRHACEARRNHQNTLAFGLGVTSASENLFKT